MRKKYQQFFFLLFSLMIVGCATGSGGHKPSSSPEGQSSYDSLYHYSLGVLFRLNDEADAAIAEYEAALKLDPYSETLTKELAELYFEKGEFQKAITLCETFLGKNPKNIDVLLLIGELYLDIKDYKKAVNIYKSVLEMDPKNITAYFYLGSTYAEVKKYDRAVSLFKKLVAIDPENLMGNYYLARILRTQKRYDDAETVFKKIIGFSPEFEAVWIDLSNLYEVQDKTDLAINNYREFIRNFPVKVGIRMRLGELLIRAKRYNEAEREFQAILEIDTRNRDARQTLGILYLDQGKNDLAVEQFLRLLQDFPADAKTGYLLATAYEEQKFFDDALKEYKRIPVVSSLFTQSQVRIASILQQQGKKNEAKKTIKDAIPNNRDFAPFYSILSVLYEEDKDFKAAEDILREGLLVAKDKIEIRYQLGSLFSKTNRNEESIREMEAILKENPDHADALNFLGYTFAEEGIKLEEAEKMIKKALQLKPGNGYILDSLGWVYYKQKRFDEALKYLKEAASALPNDGAITEHLGDVYLALNLREEALKAYRQAQKSNPAVAALQDKIDALLMQDLQ